MGKYTSSDEQPRRPKATEQLLKALRDILRTYQQDEQSDVLSLEVDTLRTKLKEHGIANVDGEDVKLGLEQLATMGLIKFRKGPIGFWDIEWISRRI